VSGRGSIGDGKSRDRAVSSQGRGDVRSTFKLPPALRLGHNGHSRDKSPGTCLARRDKAPARYRPRDVRMAAKLAREGGRNAAAAESVFAAAEKSRLGISLTLRAPNKSRRRYRRGDSALCSSCRRATAFLAEHRLGNERRKEERRNRR